VNIFRFLTSLSTSFSLVVESWPVLDAPSIIFALRFLFLLSSSHVDHTILFVPHHRNTITTNITNITITIIMFSFSSFFSAPVMAPICIAAATDVVIDTSLTTTLSFDPMDLSTTIAAAMPNGIKRKLNELYESMGETPRKHKKTKHPEVNGNKAYHKHESRLTADQHLSTTECHEWASALCKEASNPPDVDEVRLPCQYKPNIFLDPKHTVISPYKHSVVPSPPSSPWI
jgi:hypothetical protein